MLPGYFLTSLIVILLDVSSGQENSKPIPRVKINPSQELRPSSPSQYVEIAGNEYFLSEFVSLTWFESRTACEEIDMRLASIETQEENNALIEFFANSPELDIWRWTDGYRLEQSSDWFWNTTEEPFSFSGWGVNQPSNPVDYNDDCSNFAGFFGWDDDHCGLWLMSYICEA